MAAGNSRVALDPRRGFQLRHALLVSRHLAPVSERCDALIRQVGDKGRIPEARGEASSPGTESRSGLRNQRVNAP